VKALGNGAEVAGKVRELDVEISGIEFHAHQEKIGVFVGMLVGVKNISIVAKDEIGNGRHDAFLVGTAQQKDGGIFRLAVSHRYS
jgi:hypothetical protein